MFSYFTVIVLTVLLSFTVFTESVLAAGFQPRSVKSADSGEMYEAEQEYDSPKPRKKKRRKKKKRAKPKRRKTPQIREEQRERVPQKKEDNLPSPDQIDDGYPKMGLGLGIGYESRYGNGASFHLMPAYFLDINAGLGYNRSGLKGGIGADVILNFSKGVGMSIGEALVYSAGRSSDVQLEANFTPEGGGADSQVTASKGYEVTPAQIASTTLGVFFSASPKFKINLNGHYNYVVGGNEVKFSDDIRFNRKIDAINEVEFDKEFEKKAKDDVAAGGVGASIGLTVFF